MKAYLPAVGTVLDQPQPGRHYYDSTPNEGIAFYDEERMWHSGLFDDRVPLDAQTAREEAVFFAGNPGQAITYLVGKQQILALLAEASRRDGFALDDVHDRLWQDGNVPLASQRWELLGLRDDLDRADRVGEGVPW
jgi:Bacterial protein of unknown function (DUF885)